MTENTQQEALRAAQERLQVGPVDMAREMGTPYSTYRKWLAGTRQMPAVAERCLELVLKISGK